MPARCGLPKGYDNVVTRYGTGFPSVVNVCGPLQDKKTVEKVINTNDAKCINKDSFFMVLIIGYFTYVKDRLKTTKKLNG